MRAVIHVQHLLGTGHTVRAAALARALTANGVEVTLVLGARPPATLDLGGLARVQLPPVLATDATFKILLGDDGTPYEDLMDERRETFAATVASVKPDILLTETFPFGRRRFAGEVVPILKELPAPRPIVAASVRDVLVQKSPQKEREMAALARAHYDCVLVHADPHFVTLGESFGAAGDVADLIRYTGFVHAPAPAAAPCRKGIMVSAGGGDVGANLVEAAIAAARQLDQHPWHILVSHWVEEATLHRWQASAPDYVRVERNRPDFRTLLSGAALSISQAGYNTVLDVIAAGTRAILVPFAAEGEDEQTKRAAALQRRGLAQVLPESTLSAQGLAALVETALIAPLPQRPAIDLNGAAQSAAILVEAARAR
ncbi:MAG: glycosyltransferase [Pseudomonadota bacterium]